jgi:hypothetical protein
MKVLKIAVLVAFLFAASVKAGLDQLAAALPTCAVGSMTLSDAVLDPEPTDNMKLECMVSSMSHTSCALTDQKCLCTDEKYTAVLEQCVQASCTIRQSLSKNCYSAL